jgi:hypothetical protein
MHRLELNVTADEFRERLAAAKRQEVSISDHLRIALGMQPFGDPPLYEVDRERRVCLRLVHSERHPQRR